MSPSRSLEQRLLVIMAATALVFALAGGSLVFMYGYTNPTNRRAAARLSMAWRRRCIRRHRSLRSCTTN